MSKTCENKTTFNSEEKELFIRMVDYFIKSEEKEIAELRLPSGNSKFIPECEKRKSTFESIKRKVMETFLP